MFYNYVLDPWINIRNNNNNNNGTISIVCNTFREPRRFGKPIVCECDKTTRRPLTPEGLFNFDSRYNVNCFFFFLICIYSLNFSL